MEDNKIINFLTYVTVYQGRVPKYTWVQVGIPCEILAPGVGMGLGCVRKSQNKHLGLNLQKDLTAHVNIKAVTAI